MFRVYREHRLGIGHDNVADCIKAIECQRLGDSRPCIYRIEWNEWKGRRFVTTCADYTVFRKHIVGEGDFDTIEEATAFIGDSRRSDTTDSVPYFIEVL